MQRTRVVNVDEALAWVAVSLLETQVAYRAPQAVMIDAGVTRLGVPLVAIHRHSLDIPLLVDIVLAQLADCCWPIWRSTASGIELRRSLYPDWAYRHARLLSRPNSEWLGGFRTDVVAP